MADRQSELGNDTFVVRILASNGNDVLRGDVQHVRSRKRASFTTRERLLSFIRHSLQETSNKPCRN